MILKELDQLSPATWEKTVLNFAGVCAVLLENMVQAAGEPYPFPNWSLKRIIHYFLKKLGFKWNFEQFAAELRNKLTYYLQQATSGELDLAAWSSDISGAFKDDPEEALTIIKLCFIANGGQELVAEVDKAVKMLREELHSSKEFEAAVALIEKKYKMGGAQSDQRYEIVWQKLGPKAMARIKGKGLMIPGAEEVDSRNRKTFAEETSIAMLTIHEELIRRATEHPAQLIADAKNGKLVNFLVTATENDIRDQIKHEITQKRGYKKMARSVDVDNADSKTMRRAMSLAAPADPAAKLIDKETIEEFTEGLNEEEKLIVKMMVEERLTEEGVARRLDKSQPWVAAKIKGIRQKKKRPNTSW
jgi:hypothetical protein